jgi:Flp pilus assembly protein TadD
LNRVAQAENDYRSAIHRDRTFAPAYVNLADLKSRSGDNTAAIAVLRAGIEANGSNLQLAALHHSLGLALIREKRYDDAIAELVIAQEQSPDDVSYAYVLGVALHDTGKPAEGIRVLERR